MSATPFIPTGSSNKDLIITPSSQTDRGRRPDEKSPQKSESNFLESIRKEQNSSDRAEPENRATSPQPDQNQHRSEDVKTPADSSINTVESDKPTGSEPKTGGEFSPETHPESIQVESIPVPEIEISPVELPAIEVSQIFPLVVEKSAQPESSELTLDQPNVRESNGEKPPVGLILIPAETLEPVTEETATLETNTNDDVSLLPNDDLAKWLSIGNESENEVQPAREPGLQLPKTLVDETTPVVESEVTDSIDSEEPVVLSFVGLNGQEKIPQNDNNSESNEHTAENSDLTTNTGNIPAETVEVVPVTTTSDLQKESAARRDSESAQATETTTTESSTNSELSSAILNSGATAPIESDVVPVTSQSVHLETAKTAPTVEKTQQGEIKLQSPEPIASENPHVTRSVSIENNQAIRPTELPPQITKLVDQVAAAVNKAASNGQVLKIRLHPPELGVLQIELVQTENGLTARLETDTLSTQKLLKEHMSALRETLQQQGHSIEKIDVQMQQRSAGDEQQKQQPSQFADQDSRKENQTSRQSERESYQRENERSPDDNPIVSMSTTHHSDELNIHV